MASNPEIIDLASWQKLTSDIQTVKNRIDQITTNYGSGTTSTGSWTVSDTLSHEFNLGNQKLVSGRFRFVVADYTATNKLYSVPIEFGTAFSGQPIVTATIQFGSSALPTSNTNVVLVVHDVRVDSFNARLTNAGTTQNLSGSYWINWMAVGPKG